MGIIKDKNSKDLTEVEVTRIHKRTILEKS